MPTNDGAYFRGIAVGIPMDGIPAKFKIDSVKERLTGRIRFDEQRADLESVIGESARATEAVQGHVETRLEPIGHTISPLGNAVQRVIGYDAPPETPDCYRHWGCNCRAA